MSLKTQTFQFQTIIINGKSVAPLQIDVYTFVFYIETASKFIDSDYYYLQLRAAPHIKTSQVCESKCKHIRMMTQSYNLKSL